MPFTTNHAIELYYEIHSPQDESNRPEPIPVLNISGSGGDLRTSRPDRWPINKFFTVAHFDQRGLGQSAKPEGPYSMKQYADDAAALLDELGWDRAHVIGTSFGGMVAQHLALRHGERIERLVLVCTSPGGLKPSFPLHTIEPLDVEAKTELMLGLYDNRWDPGQDDPIPGLGPIYDQLVTGLRTDRSGEAGRGYRAQIEARSHHDVERQLGRITQPTLVCAGEYDDMAPPANSEALVAGIPNSRLAVFDGGHFFPIQDRTTFPTMIEFLREHGEESRQH